MTPGWTRWIAAGALIAFAGALVAQEWRGPEELEVRVEDAKGRDVEGAEVVLEYAGRELGGPAPMLTDAKGRLAIGGLLPGRWALEVRKPGFMSFRAEIALAAGERPEIVLASQHNVPGAVSTMRVRLGKARGAPPAPARVERVVAPVAAAPPAPKPAEATQPPTASEPAQAAQAEAPDSPAAPALAPGVAPSPPAASPAPKPALAAPPAPAAPAQADSTPPAPLPAVAPALAESAPEQVDTPAVEATPPAPTVPSSPAPPAEEMEPSAFAPPVAPVAAPPAPSPPKAPAARVTDAAPIARACYECRPGESALLAEGEIAAGGDLCPPDLSARLAVVSRAELPALVAGLPGGCAVLVVELPANARYAGFRYEAAGSNERSEDCLPGRPCPAGACRFPIEPVIRDEGGTRALLTLFESTAARRGAFTVYWRRAR